MPRFSNIKNKWRTTLPAILLVPLLLGFVTAGEFLLKKSDHQTHRLQFTDGSGAGKLIIDNLNGPVAVIGHDGTEVQVIVTHSYSAETPEKLERALEKIRLEINQDPGMIEFYVNAPQRGRMDRSWNDRRTRGYAAHFSFEVRVPNGSHLIISTVEDGQITVDSFRGSFELETVDGGIDLRAVVGSGKAYALNGPVKAQFDAAPREATFIGALNGEIDLRLPETLSADLRIHTFNGEVFCEFPTTALSPRPPRREKKDGMNVYHTDKATGFRVGGGGPPIEIDAFNGDVFIQRTAGS